MKKLSAVLAVVGFTAFSALSLASCGGSSTGKEGGTLLGTYASFPDYLDPQLSYTAEGWTAMYDTYIPLLTYRHASGAAGSEVIPGLAKSLPKITNGGKTYTLFLRKGLKILKRHARQCLRLHLRGRTLLQGQLAAARPSTPTSSAPKNSRRRRAVGSAASRPTTRPAKS